MKSRNVKEQKKTDIDVASSVEFNYVKNETIYRVNRGDSYQNTSSNIVKDAYLEHSFFSTCINRINSRINSFCNMFSSSKGSYTSIDQKESTVNEHTPIVNKSIV